MKISTPFLLSFIIIIIDVYANATESSRPNINTSCI
jgi:hypothetical protein